MPAAAVAAGAVGAARRHELAASRVPQVVVDDTRRAARTGRRGRVRAIRAVTLTTVGITGTNGKTTTAQLIAAVFEATADDRGRRHAARRPHDARGARAAARSLASFGTTGCRRGRDGGVVARARAPSGRRHRVRRRGVHQSRPGPPRPARLDRGVLPGQGPAVRPAFAPLGGRQHRRPVRPAARRHDRRQRRHPRRRISTRRPADVEVVERRVALVPMAGRRRDGADRGSLQRDELAAALVTAVELGIDPRRRRRPAWPTSPPIPGRFEVGAGRATARAHRDRRLRPHPRRTGRGAPIGAARSPTRGRSSIVVFGCGGDRDREKRPEMGAVAGRLADRVDRHVGQPSA